MERCVAQAENMAVLFDTRSDIELMPEPFRMQVNVSISVPFLEYVKFINSLSQSSTIELLSGTKSTINLSVNNPECLYNTFLTNMAFAIMKEIYYAEAYESTATSIVPVSDSFAEVSIDKFLQSTALLPDYWEELQSHLIRLGYLCKRIRFDYNKKLFTLACRIYAIAHNTPLRGELNLTVPD